MLMGAIAWVGFPGGQQILGLCRPPSPLVSYDDGRGNGTRGNLMSED